MLALLSLFRTLSLRYLAMRWGRAALIVLSIALGVAMLVSTQLLNQCIDAASSETTMPGADLADLVVTANHRVRLDLADKLRAVPGVAAAEPIIFERVVLPDFDNRAVVLVGVDVASMMRKAGDPARADAAKSLVTEFKIDNPIAAMSARGVVLGKELSDALAKDGKPVAAFHIRAGGLVQTVERAGSVTFGGKLAKLGGFVMAMDVRHAAKVLDQEGKCERIDLTLAPGADVHQVKHAAQAVVGAAAEVKTPEVAGRATREVVGGIRIGFTLCGIGAMVVGLFLVYNALAVSVAERRHDIGVLRSMGATRPQIAWLFAGEAILLGLFGAVVGVPLGWGLARLTFLLARKEMEQLFPSANQPLALTADTVLLALLAGVATAVLAALVPAMQAAGDEPADAVRRVPSAAGRFFRYLQAVASVLMIAAGFSVVLIREYLPKRVGGFGGMVLLLLGLLLAVPLLVGVAARLFQPLARRLFGIETRLAADNLLRAPGRTGVVVGALAAGVALMLQTAGIGRSNEEPVLDWLDRAVSCDFFVVCGDPNTSSNAVLPMQPAVRDELNAVPGVEATMALRYFWPEYNGRVVFMTAMDAKVYHDSNRNKSRLPNLGLFNQLVEPNTCLVSENFAALNHVKAGDTIQIQGPHGPVPLRVLGAIQEYSWTRGTILVDRAFYAKAFDDPLIDAIHVFLDQTDQKAAAEQRVKEFCDRNALVIVTREDFNDLVAGFIRRMYTLAYLQQIAVGVVAALGVVMALLISVLQRRRELGLLRAVGATQGQVLHTVLAEATLMGILGTILGLIAGVPLEWYLLRVVIFEESGFIFPVTVPWRETLILSALAVATATVAGLFPALHAVRLRIAEAIAYE
jgi:putative ABC transport system permease protein